jgi:hypothetical protein
MACAAVQITVDACASAALSQNASISLYSNASSLVFCVLNTTSGIVSGLDAPADCDSDQLECLCALSPSLPPSPPPPRPAEISVRVLGIVGISLAALLLFLIVFCLLCGPRCVDECCLHCFGRTPRDDKRPIADRGSREDYF